MTKTLLDNFNRADNTSLGADWVTQPAGQLQIVNNQAQMQGTSSVLTAIYNVPVDTSDMSTKFTYKAVAGTNSIITRASADGTSYYYMRRVSATTVSLGKVVSGTNTVIAGPVTVSGVNVGTVFELRAVGSLISGWLDGVKVIEVTDTAIPTGSRGGWRSTSTSVTGTAFDDFTVSDVVASGPDTIAPGNVPIVTATPLSDTSIQLTWNAATDNVAVTEYRIYVNDVYRTSTTALQFAVTGLSAATTYTFRITARDAAGNESTGNSTSAKTDAPSSTDTTPPTQPVLTVSGVGSTTANLSWTAASDNVGVMGYRIVLNGDILTTTTGTTYALSNLAPLTTYTISIRAYDAGNNTASSTTTSFTTTGAVVGAQTYVDNFDYPNGNLPSPWSQSTSNAFTVVDGKMHLNLTGAAYVAVYSASLATNDQQVSVIAADPIAASTFAVLARVSTDGANYYGFRRSGSNTVSLIKVLNGAGFTTIAPNVTTSVAAGDTMAIRVTGSTISGYVNGALVISATDTSIPSGPYGGVRTTGTGAQGLEFDNFVAQDYSGTFDTAAPTQPVITSSALTASSFTISWSPSTDNVGVSGYRVFLGGSLFTTVTSTSVTFSNLSPSTAYTTRIEAYDAAGNYTASNTLNVTTPSTSDTTAPSAVTATVGSITSTSVVVSWTAATDNVGVTGYQVFRSGGLVTTVGASVRNYTHQGLTPGVNYTFKVVAIDGAGNVGTSNNVSATTLAGSATTYTLEYWDGTSYNQLDNVETRVIRQSDKAEVGFFYGKKLELKLADGSRFPITLPEGRKTIDPWLGKSAVFYGDSSGVRQTTSGVDYTASEVWPLLVGAGWSDQVTAEDGSTVNGPSFYGYPSSDGYPNGLQVTATNRHSNSFTMQDVASRMLGPSTLKWVPGSFNIVSVFAGGNDVGKLHANDMGKLGYKHALRSVLSILRTSSTVNTFTEQGTWDPNSTIYGGNTRVSLVPGSTITASFSGTDATLFVLARVDGTGSQFTYRVDGGEVKAATTKAQAAPALLSGTHVPVAINLRGLGAGTHTVTVTHTGDQGDPLVVDSVRPWYPSETQMPFVMIAPPAYSTDAGWANYDSPKPTNTDVDAFRLLMRSVLEEFAFANNIGKLLSDMMDTFFPATDFSKRINDGLHPNRKGHRWIAYTFLENLRNYLPNNSSAGLGAQSLGNSSLGGS